MKRFAAVCACVIAASLLPNTANAEPAHSSTATVMMPDSIPGYWASDSADIARAQVGKPYVLGAKGPNAFDCSGLVYWSYSRPPVLIANYTTAQIAQTRSIPYSQILKGDLIFYGINHVAIYYDSNMMVEAANPSSGVIFTPVRGGGDVRTYR